MIVVAGTVAIQLLTAAIGFFACVWMIRRGEPGNGRAPGSTPTWAVFRARLPLIGLNLAIMFVLSIVGFTFAVDRFTLAWPGALPVAASALLILAVEDACFYAWHRALHRNKTLYRRIHRIHHQAWAPLPLEYVYVHPVEMLVGGIGPFLALAGLVLANGVLSIWVFWVYLLVRQLHELHIHATTLEPLHPALPLVGTPADHALHHARPTLGQYASIFRVWDRVFGTVIRVGR
ncbi:MAG: sterol desaturase family protein [Pseudomonadota bacterium]|nr:sterol desaturase family protein [Pseudomonadota bacterium]